LWGENKNSKQLWPHGEPFLALNIPMEIEAQKCQGLYEVHLGVLRLKRHAWKSPCSLCPSWFCMGRMSRRHLKCLHPPPLIALANRF
jgi:hypothetical protein